MKRGAIQAGITRSRVLMLIRQYGKISRIELSRHLSMDRSTMTHVIKDLLDQGILEEKTDRTPKKSGRIPVLLTLNGNYGVVLGFEYQPDFIRVVVVDLNGRILHREELKGNKGNPESFISSYLEETDLSPFPHLLGLSLAFPGIVNPYKGVLKLSQSLNLTDYSLYQAGEQLYPLLMDNDANCFARALTNKYRRNDENSNMICLIGESHRRGRMGLTSRDDIGMGIVINGKVYYGSHFNAGEPGTTPFHEKPLALIEEHERGDYLLSLFKYLESTLYLLDASSLHVGGELGSYGEYMDIVRSHTPENCSIHFNETEPFEVARGAACLFLDQLFTLKPAGEKENCLTRINWENILKRRKESSNEPSLCK
jgi:DNA-binding transcriptional ArsR family regulator